MEPRYPTFKKTPYEVSSTFKCLQYNTSFKLMPKSEKTKIKHQK